jgi:hypothetical protein
MPKKQEFTKPEKIDYIPKATFGPYPVYIVDQDRPQTSTIDNGNRAVVSYRRE